MQNTDLPIENFDRQQTDVMLGALSENFNKILYKITHFPAVTNYLIAFIILLFVLFAIVGFDRLKSMISATEWYWVFWEAGVPLGIPIFVTLIIEAISQIGPDSRPFSLTVLVDLTPWTLAFYSITLIAHSLRKLWSEIEEYKGSLLGILVVSFIVAIYTASIVQWRHKTGWEPGLQVYTVAIILAILSIWSCHACSRVSPKKSKDT